MSAPVLYALGSVVPPLYLNQLEVYELFSSLFELTSKEDALYRRVLLKSRMQGRAVAMDRTEDAVQLDQDELIDRFTTWGKRLAVDAATKALSESGLQPSDLYGIVVNTCTGYLCPGLTSYVAEALELPASCQNLDLMGMGCGGALPNLHSAGLLAMQGQAPVLSIAVEVCTATLFMGEDAGLIISNCIFGDGAAAAIIGPPGGAAGGVQLLDYEAGLYPADREILRYRSEDHRLRNVLARDVPVVAAGHIEEVLGRLLTRQDLSLSEIDHWVVHPGGYEVLEQIMLRLGLSADDLKHSDSLFTEYGNMSSPSVLFVLQRLLASKEVTAGQNGVMLAFGAGFSVYAHLVKFS